MAIAEKTELSVNAATERNERLLRSIADRSNWIDEQAKVIKVAAELLRPFAEADFTYQTRVRGIDPYKALEIAQDDAAVTGNAISGLIKQALITAYVNAGH